MPLLRYALALLICSAVSVVTFAQKPDTHFPTNDEIQNVPLMNTSRCSTGGRS